MKTWITLTGLITLLFICQGTLYAQEVLPGPGQEIELDLLRAPVSPAANLLGISNSQIEKPTDVAAFMTSIQTASGNFSVIPVSYAVDLAPAWLFAGSKITLDEFLSSRVGKSIPQSFVLSLATNTVEGLYDSLPDVTKLSAGIKFSVLRGQVSTESREQLDELGQILGELTVGFDHALDSLKKEDRKYLYLDSLNRSILTNPNLSFEEKQSLTRSIRERMVLLEDSLALFLRSYLKEDFERARTTAESLKITRYGFKLDLASGIVWDFPDLNFDQGQSSTIAAWATGGYECPCGFSLLAIARYLYLNGAPYPGGQDLILYRNYSAMDGGLRLLYAQPVGRFSAGVEAIYRCSLDYADIDPSWRFTVNAEYDVGKNKKLSLIVGRDFDGTYTGEGDLIVALNLLLGFGTGKKL